MECGFTRWWHSMERRDIEISAYLGQGTGVSWAIPRMDRFIGAKHSFHLSFIALSRSRTLVLKLMALAAKLLHGAHRSRGSFLHSTLPAQPPIACFHNVSKIRSVPLFSHEQLYAQRTNVTRHYPKMYIGFSRNITENNYGSLRHKIGLATTNWT